MTAQTKDDLRGSQIAQVGREIAEAALMAGWLDAAAEGRWGAEDWEWTDADYDLSESGLGELEPGELGEIRDAVVARLQEAVDAAEGVER